MAVSVGIAGEVIETFPEVRIGFVVARGLHNGGRWEEADARLSALEADVASGRWRPFDEASELITSWHDAYRRFGTNPRRLRPSVDALSRRLARTGRLPRVNPAVDAYNYVSVHHGLPAGAFDLGRLDGSMMIRFAVADDAFTPLGEPDVVERPVGGEVVYALGNQVLTRHWNHRDCDQTKVTPASTDVVFIIESISARAAPTGALVGAQAQLAGLVRAHAAQVSLASIDATQTRANL